MSIVHYWKKPEGLSPVTDSPPNRTKVVKLLNDRWGPSGEFQATDEMCVMVTWYSDEGQWNRAARTYGRTVAWFKGDDKDQTTGELVMVGDAGKGKGWSTRMTDLFQQAVEAWSSWRQYNGWL